MNYPTHRSDFLQMLAAGCDVVDEHAVVNENDASWLAAWSLFPGAVAYVWHSGLKCGIVFADLVAAGFEIRADHLGEAAFRHFAGRLSLAARSVPVCCAQE
jgi:hypothetical protein